MSHQVRILGFVCHSWIAYGGISCAINKQIDASKPYTIFKNKDKLKIKYL